MSAHDQDMDAHRSATDAAGRAQPPSTRERSKRPLEDVGQEGTTSKRGRYVLNACEICRRRKVKCDGNKPCQRCQRQMVECIYRSNNISFTGGGDAAGGYTTGAQGVGVSATDKSEVHRLELQVQGLQNSLNILLHSLGPLPALRASDHISDRVVTTAAVDSNTTATTDAETGSPEGGIPSVGHEQQPVKYPQFHGPTSATFPFEHARSSLKERGMNELNTIDEAVDIPSTTSAASMGDNDFDTPAVNEPLLWEIGWSETIRLCRSYTDDYDSVYPLVDMGTLAAKVRSFFNQQSSSRRDLRIRASGVVEPLSQHDVVVLKLILAVSLVAEGSGQSERGQKAFASAQSAIQHAIWQRVSIRNIQILALGAVYHLAIDNFVLTQRLTALAIKLSFELGIHRADLLRQLFPEEKDAASAVRMLWALYMIDARSSFGTGIPASIRDSDIDPALLAPDLSKPYLRTMLDYSRLSRKVLHLNRSLGTGDSMLKREEADHLDYLVLKWQDRIPVELKFYPPTSDSFGQIDQNVQASLYLRFMLYLRGNQLRNVIYRSVLCTSHSVRENQADAQSVVEIARDSLQVSSYLDKATDIYRRHSCEINRYILSALGVLLLAAINAPGIINQTCTEEYSTALDMLETTCARLDSDHHQSQKVKVLKDLGQRLNLTPMNLSAPGGGPQCMPMTPGVPDFDPTLAGYTISDNWQTGDDFLDLLTMSRNW